MEKAIIEEEFSDNQIDFYCSEDLALLLGHSTYHFYIKNEDSLKAFEILKTLYLNGELSSDFDPDKLYKKLT